MPDFITQQGLAAGGCGCTKGAGYADLIFVGRTVWVTNRVSGQILPVTADPGQVSGSNPVSAVGAIQVGKAPLVVSGGGGPLTPAVIEMSGTGQIATSSGTVRVASDLGPELWRIDPGSTAAQLVDGPDHGSTVALATGFDSVWATHPDGYVLRTSATTYLPTAIKVGHGASGIAMADNAVWVANTDDGTISRIDPETNKVVATIVVGSNPVGVVVAGGRPFVTLRGP